MTACRMSDVSISCSTGSATGEVSAYDLRSSSSRPAAVVLGRHAEPVAALAFEDPWLAVAQGSVTLVDVDAAMRGGRGGPSGSKASHKRQVGTPSTRLHRSGRTIVPVGISRQAACCLTIQ